MSKNDDGADAVARFKDQIRAAKGMPDFLEPMPEDELRRWEGREPAWVETCEALWGEYWIEPLAEVLDRNRRTIERWRSGAVPIPEPVRRAVEAIPDPDTNLGWMLRAMAAPEFRERMAARPAAEAAMKTLRAPRETIELATEFRAASPQDFLAALGTMTLLDHAGLRPRIVWRSPLPGETATLIVPDMDLDQVAAIVRSGLREAMPALRPLDDARPGDDAEPVMRAAAAEPRHGALRRADWIAAVWHQQRDGDGYTLRASPWDMVRGKGRADFQRAVWSALETAAKDPWRQRDPVMEAMFGPRPLRDTACSARWELPDELQIERTAGGSTRGTNAGVVALAAIGVARLTAGPVNTSSELPVMSLAAGWEPTASGRLPDRYRWPIPLVPVSAGSLRNLALVDLWTDYVHNLEIMERDNFRFPNEAPHQAAVWQVSVSVSGNYDQRSFARPECIYVPE